MLHQLRNLVKPFIPEPARHLYHWPASELRCRRVTRWLERYAPEVHARFLRHDLPAGVRRDLLNRLSWEPYQRLLSHGRKGSPLEADVLFVTDSPVPDLVKAVIALKRVEPSLRCALLLHSFADQGLI